MQGNFSTLLSSTIAPSAAGPAADILSVFAAGAISGAGASYIAQEFREHFSKRLHLSGGVSSSTDEKSPKVDEDPHYGKPMTRAQVEATYPEGSWQREAYEDFSGVLLDEDRIFPCIYATKGYKGDEQRYMFIDNDDLTEQRHIAALAQGLSAYLPTSRSLGPNTSLVLLAKHNESPRSMDEYNNSFWRLLDGLKRLDTTPWPVDTPEDIDTDRWCLCYGGEQWFTVIQTPAHQNRLSRYAKGVTIVFQPKWIFDILFSSDAKRAGSLAKVRALLKKYDPVPVSPELKNYGDTGSRESRQYFLLDENLPAACPFAKLGAPMPADHP